jgi:hypothetical protein
MDDIKRQLTDPNFISDELYRLLKKDQSLAESILEKHAHGESFGFEETTAKSIIAKINDVKSRDSQRQLIDNALALESLAHAISLLITENNRRLLSLISHTSP